jgi:hypothetical protein
MAESPRRVDLRLTIPAASPYRELAGELAARFAEYAGATTHDAHELAHAVESSLSGMDGAAAVDLEMSAQGNELVVTARRGQTSTRTTCRLPD